MYVRDKSVPTSALTNTQAENQARMEAWQEDWANATGEIAEDMRRQFIDSGELAFDDMGEALKRELGDALTFTQPQGGLFFWANLTGAGGKVKDGNVFAKSAIAQGVAFVPGAPFFANDPDLSSIRLSFATADLAKIEEGITRLGQALKA